MSHNVEKMFIQHIELLTSGFDKSNHPWKRVSTWVGYTALFYLLPIFFIKDTNKWTTIYKIMWVIQTIFVFSSDFGFGGPEPNIIHGIDRLLATIMSLSIIIITLFYINKWVACIGAFPPIYFIYKSKVATSMKDWDTYVINQTLWHITGPLIACASLYKIQLKHKLFQLNK